MVGLKNGVVGHKTDDNEGRKDREKEGKKKGKGEYERRKEKYTQENTERITEMLLDMDRDKNIGYINDKSVPFLSDTYCYRTKNSRGKSCHPPERKCCW